MTSEEYIARKAPGWPVTLFRVFMGCYFLCVGWLQFSQWRIEPEAITDTYLKMTARGTQLVWFRQYLDHTIAHIQDHSLFTWVLLSALGLLGLSLVLGFLTRTSCAFGILLLLHIYLVRFSQADLRTMLLMQLQMASLALLMFSGAGRTFGLDGVFWRKRMRKRLDLEIPPGKPSPKPSPKSIDDEVTPVQAPNRRVPPTSAEHTVGGSSSPTPVRRRPASSPVQQRTKPLPMVMKESSTGAQPVPVKAPEVKKPEPTPEPKE